MTTSTAPGSAHREQLRVPVRWWVLLLLLLASLWLALVVSTPPVVHWPSAGLAAALGVGLLLGYGGARVEVEDTAFRAGRARLGWAFCGHATSLDADETRRLGGVDADPRAYLLLRPYIATAVRVDVDDDADPTPYWLISTRHPRRLAEAVNARRMVAD